MTELVSDDGGEKGQQRVWLRCVADFPAGARDDLLERLSRADITVVQEDACMTAPATAPGVVLFGTPGAAVQQCLSEVLRWRARRALAVAAHAESLKGDVAWTLLRSGADDVLAWDSCPEPATTVAARLARWLEIDALLGSPQVAGRLRGRSRSLASVLRAAAEAAHFSSSPVLITGDTGTGKELLARSIHDLDPRSPKGQFVVCDCTTIVPELSGSEFFGHERGAFTGAVRAREGAFALADGGTLFLDEVGELPLGLQAELLRVIQEGTYKRVGSNQWLHTAFRLVCATHRDLVAATCSGRFREDLYYRIAGCVLRMPSLDERREDIPVLVQAFLAEALADGDVPALDSAVREYLLTRDYPGNVRELRQLVLRIGQRYVAPGPITLGTLPASEVGAANGRTGWPDEHAERTVRTALACGISLAELRGTVADMAYRSVLEDEHGDTLRTATRLRVSQRAVQQFVRGHRA